MQYDLEQRVAVEIGAMRLTNRDSKDIARAIIPLVLEEAAQKVTRAIIPLVLEEAAQKVKSLMECDGLIDADEAAAAIRAIGAP
jgi:hypothetical protein